MAVFDPQFPVVDREADDEHGPYDSWEDVAVALAFARLPPERVEALSPTHLTGSELASRSAERSSSRKENERFSRDDRRRPLVR